LLVALFGLNNASAESCLPEGITFSYQSQINNFQSNYPGCTQIDGDVVISGSNIFNLNGLSVVTSIGGSLLIECNKILTSLDGLTNVSSIGVDLRLEGNFSLTNLTGLENVTFIGGDLILSNNLSLFSLSGLSGLSSIGGALWIDDNKALLNLTGLDNLAFVAGIVRIYSNSSLTSLTGLESLTSIGGNLLIGGQEHLGGLGNPSLTSLEGLVNLTSIGGKLEIGYNTSLASLAGLDNIDAGSVNGLSIYNNNRLYECDVASICDYLSNPFGIVNISDNATGCNSQAEVEAACLLLNTGNKAVDKVFSIYPNPTPGYIFIETTSTTLPSYLTIINPNCEELMKQPVSGSKTQFDLTGLHAGVYFVRLNNDRMVDFRKILKR